MTSFVLAVKLTEWPPSLSVVSEMNAWSLWSLYGQLVLRRLSIGSMTVSAFHLALSPLLSGQNEDVG